MTAFAAPKIKASERYPDEVVINSRWRTAMTDGRENPRMEIRILAPHPDGGWLYEWVRDGEADRRTPAGRLGHSTDDNLRALFRPVGWRNASA